MSGTVASMEHRRLRRSPDALATQVDGDIMMLVLSTGMYHSLSGVAARIWEVLETPSTLDEISARIAEEYGVSLEQCRMDTQAFLADLSRPHVASQAGHRRSKAAGAHCAGTVRVHWAWPGARRRVAGAFPEALAPVRTVDGGGGPGAAGHALRCTDSDAGRSGDPGGGAAHALGIQLPGPGDPCAGLARAAARSLCLAPRLAILAGCRRRSDRSRLGGLWARRWLVDRVRYISTPSDHLMLALLLAIGITGLGMRFVATGWVSDAPASSAAIKGSR